MTNKKIAQVCYRDNFNPTFNSGPYSFFCDIDVKVGDLVVTDSRFGLALGKVTGFTTELEIRKKNGYDPKTHVLTKVVLPEKV
jgi:hypothetical protein